MEGTNVLGKAEFRVGIADYSPVTSVTEDTQSVRENSVSKDPNLTYDTAKILPIAQAREAVMKVPKWFLCSFLGVAFLPINLCVALASIQVKPTGLGATQEPPCEYQSGKIVAVQTTEWQTEYVVQISVQVKDTVYIGECVTEERSMAPPSGLANDQPVSVRLVKGKMFLKLANGKELITQVIK